MKIRGIHAAPFGGQEGGRTLQLRNKGFTIIRIHGNKLKRDVFKTDDVIETSDVIETPVATLKGNRHPAIYRWKSWRSFYIFSRLLGHWYLIRLWGLVQPLLLAKNWDGIISAMILMLNYCEDARQRVLQNVVCLAATPI